MSKIDVGNVVGGVLQVGSNNVQTISGRPPHTNRGYEWRFFADMVLSHVENYTVPQYGDYPDDPICDFTDEEIIAQLKRYVNRAGTNVRGEAESQRDLFKIAHYACLLWSKRCKEGMPCG